MNVRTLPSGSVLVDIITQAGSITGEHYTAHRGRVWIVTDKGTLVPAFGGLKIRRGEMLEAAVRRGLRGERGTLVRTMTITYVSALVIVAVVAAACLVRLA